MTVTENTTNRIIPKISNFWTCSLQKFWKPLLRNPPNYTQQKEGNDRQISMQIDTAYLRLDISTFFTVVRKVKPEFLHKPRRWHTVVKLSSNVTTIDSRRVHFSKQLDPNNRMTCEVAKIGTLNYLATTAGQLRSALRRYTPSPTRRSNFQLLMAADVVKWQTICTFHMPRTQNTATA
jgi:hypothetical protein